MNTGEEPVTSESGLLTTIAYGLDGKVNYFSHHHVRNKLDQIMLLVGHQQYQQLVLLDQRSDNL
jgi:hypothetical protein